MRARALSFLVLLSGGAVDAMAVRPVTWTASLREGRLAASQKSVIEVEAVLDPGWYIYSLTQPEGGPLPTAVALLPGVPLRGNGKVGQPIPDKHYDPLFKQTVESFSGRAEFSIPVRVSEDAKPSRYSAVIQVGFQLCNGRTCLLPEKLELEANFVVAEAPPPKGTPNPQKGRSPR